MLTAQEDSTLTGVGSGTPMGDLLRRYWYPIAAAEQLEDKPIKAVTLLGESLVLYRDGGGRLGLVAEACAHRRVSLVYGIPENEGIRCAYHGWRYDADGKCIEQPAEDDSSLSQNPVSIQAYRVEELGGLIFAYLGPNPAPLLPRYNLLSWEDAVWEANGSVIPCNWLQVMENMFDPIHVEWLHGRFFAHVLAQRSEEQAETFLARHAPTHMKKIAFDRFEHGVIQRSLSKSEEEPNWKTGDALFFPTTMLLGPSKVSGSAIFIVPIDDTHTWFLLHMANRVDVQLPKQERCSYFDVPGANDDGTFKTGTAHGQDYMVAVTPGEITPRNKEHLGRSDAGIVLYRQLLQDQMALVGDGGEPINVRRNEKENQCIELPKVGGASMGNGHMEVLFC